MKAEQISAASIALQVLEGIRAVHPELIADHMPQGWGMNRLRAALNARAPVRAQDAAIADSNPRSAGITLSALYAKWDQLADVPIDEDDAIQAPFLHFAKGADRQTIWHWFEQQHPDFRVADVQRGIRRVDAPSLTAAAQEQNADSLAGLVDLPATHMTVYCLAIENDSTGSVDWYRTQGDAEAAFDAAEKDANFDGDEIQLFSLQVPSAANAQEVTKLADQAMWDKTYVPQRTRMPA